VGVQLLSQVSPLVALPSSHSSPAVTTPLPQRVTLQLLSQPSPSVVLPSSQSSNPSRTPLPQGSAGGASGDASGGELELPPHAASTAAATIAVSNE
jgi:hypothetical protein